jgi:hypothetical protein
VQSTIRCWAGCNAATATSAPAAALSVEARVPGNEADGVLQVLAVPLAPSVWQEAPYLPRSLRCPSSPHAACPCRCLSWLLQPAA